jgi:gas vesicle protein
VLRAKKSVIVAAAIIGAGTLGVLAGLFFAPASGAETRRRLGRRIEEESEMLRLKGRQAVERVGETASSRIAEGTRKVGELIHS